MLLLLLFSTIIVQAHPRPTSPIAPLPGLPQPELLDSYFGQPWVKFAPPVNQSRPISAIVLAEMLTQQTNLTTDANMASETFEELMSRAAPGSAGLSAPFIFEATLPGLSFLAPNRTSTASTSTVAQTAPLAYQTSDIVTTTTNDGGELIASLIIDNITITGTFVGQQSQYLPQQVYMPSGPNNNKSYADLLGDSLWFYEQQRSGLLFHPNRVSWRNNSALHDGLDHQLDLTGGYFDAGDYIKCTFPLSATISYMAYGMTQYMNGVQAANQLGYLDQMLRWGYDWLIKAHPQPEQLYVQVGDSNRDNDYWGSDLTIPEPRAAFAINASAPGTDVAAGTAAAFAAGAILYAKALGDETYAQELLAHATQLYAFAESAPKMLYQVSIPAAASTYPSSDYGDELVWGALQLFIATGNVSYLQKADHYAQHYSLTEQAIGTPVDWDSKHGIALLLGAQLAAQGADTMYAYRSGLERYVDALMKQQTTPASLLWFTGSSQDSSLVEAVDSAFILFSYASLPDVEPSRIRQAMLLGQSQLDYVLGDNPAKRVYVLGTTTSSPKNPHSAMASGGKSLSTMDTFPAVEARALFGAMVGGPSQDDSYQDKRSNWRQSEIALDYNALLTPILAMKAAMGELPYYAGQSNTSF